MDQAGKKGEKKREKNELLVVARLKYALEGRKMRFEGPPRAQGEVEQKKRKKWGSLDGISRVRWKKYCGTEERR